MTSAKNPASTWSTLCVVATTVPSAEEAAHLARSLVQQQAAACVQVEPITSHYVWEGEMHATPEWRLVCKTLPDVLERSEEHTSELQSPCNLVCRLLLEKKNKTNCPHLTLLLSLATTNSPRRTYATFRPPMHLSSL